MEQARQNKKMAGKWYNTILTITFFGASSRHQGTARWVMIVRKRDSYDFEGFAGERTARSAM